MSYFARVNYLDTRSLSLFRIFLGLFLMCDILARLNDLSCFYTENGVIGSSYDEWTWWSAYTWSGLKNGYSVYLE